AMARRYMSRPTHIRAQDPDDDGATLATTRQLAYRAHALDKVELLARILQAKGRGLSIVFVRTKRTAAKVADELADRGFAAASLHGDLGQGAREQALRAFRHGKVDVLVATDVAARGIDVDDVTHVVNYQCPEDEKTYVHRIGRTGRAGHTGTAITFVDWDDVPRWLLIDRALDLGIGEPAETYSSSPHVYSDLGIAETATGRLPRSQRTRAGLSAEEVEDLGETGGRGKPSGGRSRGGSRHGGRGGNRNGSGRGNSRGRSRGGSAGGSSGGSSGRGGPGSGSAAHQSGDRSQGSAAGGNQRRRRRRRRTRGGKPAGGGNTN